MVKRGHHVIKRLRVLGKAFFVRTSPYLHIHTAISKDITEFVLEDFGNVYALRLVCIAFGKSFSIPNRVKKDVIAL